VGAGREEYRLDTDEGPQTLPELFDGRSQLLVYHFMFGPSYQAGCPTCSSMADGVDGLLPHLHARDVTMLFVSCQSGRIVRSADATIEVDGMSSSRATRL
jgi:predicted dithiol-disulfide oxidoreductase (DUF899 family)